MFVGYEGGGLHAAQSLGDAARDGEVPPEHWGQISSVPSWRKRGGRRENCHMDK